MLKKILFAVVILVAAFALLAAFQSPTFYVVRTATISAPAATIFGYVNDLHQWESWSPWAKLDPQMTQTYEGPATGPGASYTWSGDSKVGAGRMTIEESRAPELVRIRLEFLRPFAATNTAEFTFTPGRDQTTVTWSMTGKKNFLTKAFGLIMNMERLVGSDFEKGLSQLQALAEKPAPRA